MIRSIVAIIFVFFFLVLGLPVLGFEWLFAKINQKEADISSLRVVQWAFRVVIAISGANVIIKGEEHIPTDSAALFIGNHRSIFDVVIGYSLMKTRTGFISKNNIEKVPILRVWMRRLYCLFLDRDNPRDGLRVVLAAIDSIKKGISIFVFPEGTRTKTGEMAPFKEGTFKIATKTNCPIIPVAFSNTEQIFEDHFPWLKPTTVVVHFGAPIHPSEIEDKKKIGAYTQTVIEEMRKEDQHLY